MSPLTCNPWGVLRGKRVKLLIVLNMMNTAKRMEMTVQVGCYIIVNNFIFYFRRLAWLNEHRQKNSGELCQAQVCHSLVCIRFDRQLERIQSITPHHETNNAVQ